jgi:hypothetical protein
MWLPVPDIEVEFWPLAAETAAQGCPNGLSSPNQRAIVEVVGDTARCQV